MRLFLIRILKIFIKLLSGGAIVLLIYFFRIDKFIFGNNIFENPFYDYLKDLDLWIYIILWLIVLSILNIIVLGILNVYFTMVRTIIENKKVKFEKIYAIELTDYFFSEVNDEKYFDGLRNKFKESKKSNTQFVTFLGVYAQLQENLAMDLSGRFHELLVQIGARKKLVKLLHSDDYSNIILAIKVISYLRIAEYNNVIIKYLKSKSFAVRSEALTAIIRLSKEDNLSVLFQFSHHISLLDVNIIVNAVLRNNKMHIDFKPLLKSNNPRIILIAVLIIRYRKLHNLKDDIKELISYCRYDLQFDLWNTYIELEDDKEALAYMVMEYFNILSSEIKQLILTRIKGITDESYISFVKEVIQNDPSITVKVAAIKYLFDNNYSSFQSMNFKSNDSINRAYKDVIDYFV